jgi:hypothetical protein
MAPKYVIIDVGAEKESGQATQSRVLGSIGRYEGCPYDEKPVSKSHDMGSFSRGVVRLYYSISTYILMKHPLVIIFST